MLPQLKETIATIVRKYYNDAKADYNSYAINRKPKDHIFKDLHYLKEHLQVNKKLPKYTLTCKGSHEVSFLVNFMVDLKDSLDFSPDQVQWTDDLYNNITVRCLHEYPRTRGQKEVTGSHISLEEGKQMILTRIRNMLLTQNI